MTAPGRRKLPDAPIAWGSLVDEYLTWMRAIGRSPITVELRRSQLRHVAREIGGNPTQVTHEDLIDWFARYAHWMPETRRSYRAAVRGLFEWAYKFGRMVVNPATDLPQMPSGDALPKPVPDLVWRDALANATPRVTVMLRLAAEAGLRRAEISRVHTRDLLNGVGGAQLVVHGKGGKKRLLPLSADLAALVAAGAAGHTSNMQATGWLFPDGLGSHISPQSVGRLVGALLPPGYSCHKLRHRFASRAYRGTRNLRAVQTLLGHASIATTERYTAVDDYEMRAAMMAAALN
ncbi:tyrosine-type recombinase/integrase [Mycolicibacterium frederiksbergense]|uniref:tyrosine-type recombinase/integrase n=1 Tax=Mycolicibacterium frederiksbergense TaxID=117567 RepID=UPI00265C80FF|nr:tyrosine-type recombinase/integrase [Mycolicibacterium frederiksbergense]MDO0975983.1 tyrosine-type recombinase/integrase [Mycolicibacterium frederiksbergense]